MKYHHKLALLNNHFGQLNYWAWKGCYIFLDFEDNKPLYLDNLNDVEILSKDEGDKIYHERNYSTPNPGEIFTDRQQKYGKIHDNVINLTSDFGTSGQYTNNFCRCIAYLISQYHATIELINDFDGDQNNIIKQGKKDYFVAKYLIGEKSMYDIYCEKSGLHDGVCQITETEILSYLDKLNLLPDKFKTQILNSAMMNNEEIQHFMSIRKNKIRKEKIEKLNLKK